MIDQPKKPTEPYLKDADPFDVKFSLAHALQFDGKKPYRQASGFAAQIAAEHIYNMLIQAGYVIKKKPPATANSTRGHMPPRVPMKD